MTKIEVEPKRLGLFNEYGIVPFTREEGHDAALKIEREIGAYTLLLLDFEEVQGIGVGFFDPVMGALRRLSLSREMILSAAVNTNPDIDYTLELYIRHIKSPGLALAKDRIVSLLTTAPKLALTFDAAKEFTTEQGSFTSVDLSENLGLNLTTAGERLARLKETGAVGRYPDRSVVHGKRFAYRAVTEDDVFLAREQ